VSGSANGFRLHSADASWTSFSGAIVSTSWSSAFTTGTYINLNPSAETPHLSGADTIGFAGLTLMGGVASGFNAITFTITTHFPASETGKKVALDTSWYPPAGEWLWTTDGWQGLVPGWGGGPYSSLYNAGGLQGYVFTIAGSGPCCVGIRGNVNGDALEDINISDITYLVAYAFKHGPAPPCPEEADCDGDLSLNVSDVTYLVKYAFKSGPAPVACP
jgi:hypothetical protein